MAAPKSTPVRFVLDLRKVTNNPTDQEHQQQNASQNGEYAATPNSRTSSHSPSPLKDKCARLEGEVNRLRESESGLLDEVSKLKRELATLADNDQMVQELEKMKRQLAKLQEDYKVALDLIVTLGATVVKSGPASVAKTSSRKGETDQHFGRLPPFVPSSTGPASSFNMYALGGTPQPSRQVQQSGSRKSSLDLDADLD